MGVTDRDDVRRLLDSLNGAGYSLLVADPADTIRSMCEELIEGDADFVELQEKYDKVSRVEEYALEEAKNALDELDEAAPDYPKARTILEAMIEELEK